MSYDKSVPQPSRRKYQKVPTNDVDRGEYNATDDVSAKRARRQRQLARDAKRKETIEAIQTKMWAAVWTAAMIAVIYFTDFFLVLLTSDRVNRTWFNLSVLCWGVDLSCLFYLAVYLPFKGIDLEWNVPRVNGLRSPDATGGHDGAVDFTAGNPDATGGGRCVGHHCHSTDIRTPRHAQPTLT